MFCKTIILSNSQNISSNAPKGILTISKENNYIKGKIRLYNLTTLPNTTKVGLYINNQVYTQNLIKKTNHYEFDLNESIDINQSVYCALIDPANNKQVLLEGGSLNGFSFSDSPFDAVLESKDEELENCISNALNEPSTCSQCDCENCEYKKYFYEHHTSNSNPATKDEKIPPQNNNINQIELFQDSVIETLQKELVDENLNAKLVHDIPDNENQKDFNNNDKSEFLNDIIYQLDEMFVRYPADEMLNSIIPNAKFIRVDGENPYVLGIIYENKIMKYLAYGVPAQYNSLPPNDFGQHYQWLPLNPRDTMSDGYFMIYQNALTGNIVEINFEE